MPMDQYTQFRLADFMCHASPLRFAYWVGLRVADRYYSNDARGRAAVMANLRYILEYKGVRAPEETLEKLARKTFQNFGKHMVDFFRTTRISRREVDRRVGLEHFEYVEEAQALDRGVLVVSAHLGSWEIGAAVFAALGCPLNVVILPEPDKRIRALFRDRRERRGTPVIPLGHAARGILRALAKKEQIALLADRDYTSRNMSVRFFGRPARFPRGPAVLCSKTKAPIVPAFLVRQEDDTFLFRFHPPIVPDDHSSPVEIQERICRVLEEEIADRPTQWFMFDDFWADAPSKRHVGNVGPSQRASET